MMRKVITTRHVILALFVLYALAILFFLIIPNNYRGHNVLIGGLTLERWTAYVLRNFNFVPFRSLSEQISSIFAGQSVARNMIYLAGNFVGFAPLGYFLPTLFAWQRKFPAFLITCILAIAVLELMQVMTMRGSCDIDDIILNAAGACIGFVIMRKFIPRVARFRSG